MILSPVTFALLAVIAAVSLRAFAQFKSHRPAALFLFVPSEVARGRNLLGMLLSQFSHADMAHLLFNCVTLFFFGPIVEAPVHPADFGPAGLGSGGMALVYAAAAVGSTLLTFVVHRKDPTYSALGASGAISGVLFAAIVLQPDLRISLGIVPIFVPAPLFAIGYLIASAFAAKHRLGNVGHEAHIGGAVTGMLLAAELSGQGFRPLVESLRHMLG